MVKVSWLPLLALLACADPNTPKTIEASFSVSTHGDSAWVFESRPEEHTWVLGTNDSICVHITVPEDYPVILLIDIVGDFWYPWWTPTERYNSLDISAGAVGVYVTLSQHLC